MTILQNIHFICYYLGNYFVTPHIYVAHPLEGLGWKPLI